MSWNFIANWTKSSNQDFIEDNRGWQKGKTRTHTDDEKQLIKNIREELEKSNKLYIGPKAILKYLLENNNQGKWNKDINLTKINLSFIKSVLREFGLASLHQKRRKGISKYQHYPKRLISEIGSLILEVDFIQRFISGQSAPVHFIAFSCKSLGLKQYRRISAQTNENVRKELKWFFNDFFIPDAVKMDNDLAFIGSASAIKTISKTIKFLFDKKIIPIFTNPRSPWNNGSMEGSNSVFSRNFWCKFTFESTGNLDKKLELFNKSSLWYSDYDWSKIRKKEAGEFIPQIYFIRKVYENQKNGKGEINILNEKINLPKEYINLYTLSQWSLKTETLYVYFEKEQEKMLIEKMKFEINKNCKVKI